MSRGAAQTLNDNRLVTMSGSTGTAALGIGRKFGGVAGAAVQPAVWVLDHAVNGTNPDGADMAIWLMGLLGPKGAAASFAMGLLKGASDDRINRLLAEVRRDEPETVRPFIQACVRYSFNGAQINAQTIASMGGTVWLHPNGLWVYVTDATRRLVADYYPAVSSRVMGPRLPLQRRGGGRYLWGYR